MFGISGTELLIILFFGFLILGPEKLPQVGRTVGRAIRQFRDASEAANKKFKEEVADPFQEAIAPYKDQVDESAKPIQEDIAAINQTFNETKSMFTDPFKDIFSPSSSTQDNKVRAGAVISTGVAVDDVASSREDVPAQSDEAGADPFSGVISDNTPEDQGANQEGESKSEPAGEAKPIPQSGGVVKKSLAASLYDLDEEDGE